MLLPCLPKTPSTSHMVMKRWTMSHNRTFSYLLIAAKIRTYTKRKMSHWRTRETKIQIITTTRIPIRSILRILLNPRRQYHELKQGILGVPSLPSCSFGQQVLSKRLGYARNYVARGETHQSPCLEVPATW